MLICLTKLSSHKAEVKCISDTGEIYTPRSISRYSEKDTKWLASLNPEWNGDVKIVNAELLELCGDNESPGEPNTKGYDVENEKFPLNLIESNPEEQATRFVCVLRDIEQPKSNGIEFDNENPELAFKAALQHPLELREGIIEWADTRQFCCLDIDYHDTPEPRRPTETELHKLVQAIRPLPYCWHRSHGSGAKLYYAAKPGFSAEELASVAALMWVTSDPRSSFDLIKSTRHPLYGRSRDSTPPACASFDSIKFTHGSGDVSSLRRLLNGEMDETDTTEFLASRNWHIGQTLPHSECPIDPTTDQKHSVYVGEAGLFCHRCAARGMGTNRPGFVGFNQLLGKSFDSRLYRMVKNFCHLEHAKIVLSNIYPHIPNRTLETIYRVLMKICHSHDDPRINMAMFAGKGFIRLRGQWVSADGEHSLEHNLPMFVKSLPAVLIPKEDEFAVNIPALTAFTNSCDLSEYGYEDISFIKGCKIYGVFNKTPEITKVNVRREFVKHVPTYVPLNKRMQSADAWGLIQQEFPGIDETYLRLLIAAKGSSEGRTSQCPYILVNGPSGSGKSTTAHIAAGICGDIASEPIFVPHMDRFRQSLMDASRSSGFVLVNEVFKHARASKLSPTQALDPLLSLTEDSRSHVLYVGSVPFGRLPVFVLTDIDCPPEVEQDIQLSRRFTFYRLTHRNYWSDTFVQKRIRPHEFRLISADHNAAADCILSEVIDRWFREPTSLEDIAKSLDIATLQQHSEEVDNTQDRLKRLFEATCKAEHLIGPDRIRYPGVGYKRIDRVSNSDLRNLYDEFADGLTPDLWGTSRILQAEDWQKVLGLTFPVVCEVRTHRGLINYIRFRSTDSARKPAWCNGEMLK